MVKPDNAQAAEECFHHTQIKITTQGAKILRAALGVTPLVEEFVHDKVACWVNEVEKLFSMAKDSPYAVFTCGLSSKWSFLMHTIPDIEAMFQPLEDAIRLHSLPAIIRRQALSDR